MSFSSTDWWIEPLYIIPPVSDLLRLGVDEEDWDLLKSWLEGTGVLSLDALWVEADDFGLEILFS